MIYHSHKWDKIVGKHLRRGEMVLSSADVPPIHGKHVVKTIIIWLWINPY